jgi:hypothetical protein
MRHTDRKGRRRLNKTAGARSNVSSRFEAMGRLRSATDPGVSLMPASNVRVASTVMLSATMRLKSYSVRRGCGSEKRTRNDWDIVLKRQDSSLREETERPKQ